MTGNILKYVGFVLFLLLLGFCLSPKIQEGRDCVADDGKTEKFCIANNSELEGGQMVMFSSGVSISPEEVTRGGSSQQIRELFKSLHVYLKDVIRSSRQNDTRNFIHLLSSRHEKGFYLYTLEKLLI